VGVLLLDHHGPSLEAFMQTIEQATPEQLAKRKANLERKQRQRAREKSRSVQAMEDHLEKLRARAMNDEGIARRTKSNECMLGEISPGVDASTLEDALEVAREMARALGSPDVQEGESLHDFEHRVFDAWINYEGFRGGNNSSDGGGAPHLNRKTGELSPGRGKVYWQEYCGGFDECWQPLPGTKEKLDPATLPKLRKIKKPEEIKPEPKAIPPLALPAPIPQQQPGAIHFTYLSPDAHRYLNGSK
jgi:hypothetical protein